MINASTSFVPPSSLRELMERFSVTCNELSQSYNRSCKKMAEYIIGYFLHNAVLNGEFRWSIIDFAKIYYQNTIFHPAKILKQMDQNGAKLNDGGVNVMCSLETGGKKNVRNTIIPHSESLRRICAIVESYADSIIPFTMGRTNDGIEFIEFKPSDLVPLIFRKHKVEEIAKESSIHLDIAIDSEYLSNNIYHTTCGFQFNDPRGLHPSGCEKMCDEDGWDRIQSSDNCFPIRVELSHESNAVIDRFKSTIKEMTRLSKDGFKAFKPITISFSGDTSAIWKLSGKGSAMKKSDQACYCCAEQNDFIGHWHHFRCSAWCQRLQKDDPSFKCRHQDIFGPENIQYKRELLEEVNQRLGSLVTQFDVLQENALINKIKEPRAPVNLSCKSDISSIHLRYNN